VVARKPKMSYKVSLGYYYLCQSIFIFTSFYCVLLTVNLALWSLPHSTCGNLPHYSRPHNKNGRERLSSQYKCRQTHLQSSIHVSMYTQQHTLAHIEMGKVCLLTKRVSVWGLIKIIQIGISWVLNIYVL